MNILGLACGRKMDNTEILVKTALMAAGEAGAAVSFMRLADLDIKPCKGCSSCLKSMFSGGDGNCVLDDDLPLLNEAIMECDGLILGSPVYTSTPSALLKAVVERFAPSHDNCFRMEAGKIAAKKGTKGPDERSFKNRVGAFISAGGGRSYVAISVPLMNYFTYPMGIKVIDQLPLSGLWYGSAGIVENEVILERARQLGRNVKEAIGKPEAGLEWMAEDPGICPVCHSSIMVISKHNPVECPICGARGTIRVEGDRIIVDFPPDQYKKSRFSIESKLDHWNELFSFATSTGQVEEKPETARKLKKYLDYLEK
jgi:multimeric flavodoxin WrbA